jgi:HEAT repeat protein
MCWTCVRFGLFGLLVWMGMQGGLMAQEPPAKKETPPPKKAPPKDPVVEGRPLSAWLRQLNEPDALARQRAAAAIARLRGRAVSATPTALALLKDQQDLYNRQLGAYLLAYIRPDPNEVAPALVQSLQDPDATVRRQASVALSAMGAKAKGWSKELVELLKSPNADERQLAAFVLGNVGGPGPAANVVQALIQAAKRDPSEFVRKSAAEAVKKLDPQAAEKAGI